MHCTLHSLRSSTNLARLVLAWFLLTLGVAMASPLVAPSAMELVCSAGGAVKLVAVDRDGDAPSAGPHALDCVLCLGTALPMQAPLASPEGVHPLEHALAPIEAARIASLAGAPLPPRGPPVFL